MNPFKAITIIPSSALGMAIGTFTGMTSAAYTAIKGKKLEARNPGNRSDFLDALNTCLDYAHRPAHNIKKVFNDDDKNDSHKHITKKILGTMISFGTIPFGAVIGFSCGAAFGAFLAIDACNNAADVLSDKFNSSMDFFFGNCD